MQFKITKQLRAFFSVVALFAFSITFAQSPTVTISVPFSDGAIGTVGQNTQKNDNAKSFATLGISRVYFSQEVDASSGVFYDDPSTQGNNIIGQLQIVFVNGNTATINGEIVWRTNNESFGFIAENSVSFNINEYVSSVNYLITGGQISGSSTNFSLLRNDATWAFDDSSTSTDDISGNAAGTLDDLNAYLALSESSKPDGPITVTSLSTCDTTPIISGTVSMSMESGEYIVVTVDEVSYSYTNTNSNTSNITYDSGAKTWNLQIPSAIATGTYSVDASIYNAGGYQLLDTTSSELEILENILPTISNQSFSYDENRVSGAVVGTVTVTSGTSLTYSIISGDTTYYSIDSSTGAIALTSIGASSIANDFESTPNAFSVVVQVANTCNSTATATITLNVNDIDETETTPPTVNDQSFTYAENQSSGYTVGTVSATDNVGVSTYSIQSGNTNGYFAINASTGAITLTA
ncbi:MAG: cadherin repeat domain-containing protein, partial [Flavobacteriaceae bacterium]|nr:cadherin repeat domain-containing protein [Flavobacteriaceae bacterium]